MAQECTKLRGHRHSVSGKTGKPERDKSKEIRAKGVYRIGDSCIRRLF